MTSSAFHAVAEKVTVDSETMGFGVKLTCPVPDGAEVIRISGYPGDFSPALVNLAVFHYQPPGAELSSRIDFAGIRMETSSRSLASRAHRRRHRALHPLHRQRRHRFRQL